MNLFEASLNHHGVPNRELNKSMLRLRQNLNPETDKDLFGEQSHIVFTSPTRRLVKRRQLIHLVRYPAYLKEKTL